MPELPMNLLRPLMDHQGWFERQPLQLKEILDMFAGAIGPPGRGRNLNMTRFQRSCQY
jgi:hypothetical protein